MSAPKSSAPKSSDDEWSAVDSDDPRLVAAVREYMAALEDGSAPSRTEFLERHREIAADLAICLDGLEMVHSAAVKVRRQPPPRLLLGAHESQPLGDFQIVREIGRGGMGVVYEALQLSLGRRVALKVLPFAASLDPSRLERFRNEAQAAARLHHTNIVPVYSVGIDRGVHFYAMQLIDGQALSFSIGEMRRADGRAGGLDPSETELGAMPAFIAPASVAPAPSPAVANAETQRLGSTLLSQERSTLKSYFRTVVRLIQQAALALEHAHGMGIVHRDIKPGNLLLDRRGNLWVTDFGLAQFHTDAELTRTGDLLGTLRYMSPEQAAGGRVLLDHRTDIYSLGATMYEVLTLEPILEGTDRNLLLRRIIEDEPRAPRTIVPSIPVELETIILKAIAKAPADRYATAQQFSDDLQRWLDDKPILARRPAVAERVRRWRRRHRTVVRAAAVVFLLGVMGLAVGAVVIAREHAETAAAYRRELKQHTAAEESFRQARQAIDTFTELAEEELAAKPSLHALRRKFLEKSLEYYNAFLAQRANDPTLSSELKATSQRVARIVDELALLDQLAPLMLLDDPDVQDELKIPNDRRPEIETLLTQLWQERERARSVSNSGPEVPQTSVTDSLRSHGEKLFGLLNPQQIGRLRQIAWQLQGPLAFKSPDIVAALQLTPDERTQINVIIERMRPAGPPEHDLELRNPHPPAPSDERGHGPAGQADDISAIPPGGNDPGREEPREDGPGHRGPKPDHHRGPPKPYAGSDPEWDDTQGSFGKSPEMIDREERTIAAILEVLTPQQRATWSNLIGERFISRHRRDRNGPPPRHLD